jgi:hypothetical protein
VSVEFMVLAAPRSGTAWASVWLEAYHDPLWDYFYEDIDSCGAVGICCTGLGMFPQFLRTHPARKVVLHRPKEEVTASLLAMGLGPGHPNIFRNLEEVKDAIHCNWLDLFDPAKARDIYHWLTNKPFDEARHKRLSALKITTDWRARKANSNPDLPKRYSARGITMRPPR